MTLIFRRPFILRGFDEALPAGIYRVETVEELLEGPSFTAYRWLASSIKIPPPLDGRTVPASVNTSLDELDAALIRDGAWDADPCGNPSAGP